MDTTLSMFLDFVVYKNFFIFTGTILYAISIPFFVYSIRRYVWQPYGRRDNAFRMMVILFVVSLCIGVGYTTFDILALSFIASFDVLRDIERAPFQLLRFFVLYVGSIGLPVAFILTPFAMPRNVSWRAIFIPYLAALIVTDVTINGVISLTVPQDFDHLWGQLVGLLVDVPGALVGSIILATVLPYAETRKRLSHRLWKPLAEICAGGISCVLLVAALTYFGFAYRRSEGLGIVLDEWYDVGFALSFGDALRAPQEDTTTTIFRFTTHALMLGYNGEPALTFCTAPRQCDGVDASFVLGRGGLCVKDANDKLRSMPLVVSDDKDCTPLEVRTELCPSGQSVDSCTVLEQQVFEITSTKPLLYAGVTFIDKPQDVIIQTLPGKAIDIRKDSSDVHLISISGTQMVATVPVIGRNLIVLYNYDSGSNSERSWDIGVNTEDGGYVFHNAGRRGTAIFVNAGQNNSWAQLRPAWVI